MTTTLTKDIILAKLTDYVRREFLHEGTDDDGSELEPSTPLLQLGIMNSMNTGQLLAYVREEFGIAVPPTRITGKYFRDLASIAALLIELRRG